MILGGTPLGGAPFGSIGLGSAESLIPRERRVLSGSGQLVSAAGSVSGVGAIFVAKQRVTSGGANFSQKLPDPFAIIAEARRRQQEFADALVLHGDGSIESAHGEVLGSGRIKRVALVASSASASSHGGEVTGRDVTIYDTELEMIALLLAA